MKIDNISLWQKRIADKKASRMKLDEWCVCMFAFEILDWKPGQPRTGKVDFEHKAGKNYSRLFDGYKNGKISLYQLKAFQSYPNNFRIEGFSTNRSHAFEKTLLEITKGFPWVSSLSNNWKELNYAN